MIWKIPVFLFIVLVVARRFLLMPQYTVLGLAAVFSIIMLYLFIVDLNDEDEDYLYEVWQKFNIKNKIFKILILLILAAILFVILYFVLGLIGYIAIHFWWEYEVTQGIWPYYSLK